MPQRNKKFNLQLRKKRAKKSRLAEIPAWGLSIMSLTASVGFILVLQTIGLPNSIYTEIVIEVIYIIFLIVSCFITCKTHPKSIWYTPFICNTFNAVMLIGVALKLPDLTFSIELSGLIVLSVIGAFIGARIGRRKIN